MRTVRTLSMSLLVSFTFLFPAQQGICAPDTAATPEGSVGATAKVTGKVTQTMNSGGYTYVEVDDGTKKTWAAAPQFRVNVGDTVIVPPGMPMENFASKTLGRTFDVVVFVPSIEVAGVAGIGGMPAAAHGASAGIQGGMHPNPHGPGAVGSPPGIDLTNIEKAKGGYTVSELFTNKAKLNGKEVQVRGRVVKFSQNILGKNWLHLQDGTGSTGTNDLVVSTTGSATVGDLVVIKGKLVTDRDLGMGYRYEILVEEAEITRE